MPESLSPDNFFIPFDRSATAYSLPEKFSYPFAYKPHALALVASEKLQVYLQRQQEWEHNFGLVEGQQGTVIGKMFGVLVVETAQNELGYLAAFSGKLAGSYHHLKFVPPVYDSLAEGSFLNTGMRELTRINQEIGALEKQPTGESKTQIELLRKMRKTNSVALQEKLFDQYHFRNQAGEEKSLRALFHNSSNGNPPAGAGDCAAPKLFQYAFQHNMKPIALAEFWWGLSPKSAHWKHGHFYPACQEKCQPILAHMLQGIAMDEKPQEQPH
ncbi:pseudouridylate synthase [Pontibacter sp. JH31]|uniref:Pseudouridylate synthase n=1 Tax=Pontibacter aquaedesilientis TaxID=2766980 RepID=A0ABR7XHM8_9BACT|nr:pseudouridylate synthase [Pontibacter aquaedesilientis]MBD1397761.1 pseudouridylate synthase [Pontibacter aquaedesilientis]